MIQIYTTRKPAWRSLTSDDIWKLNKLLEGLNGSCEWIYSTSEHTLNKHPWAPDCLNGTETDALAYIIENRHNPTEKEVIANKEFTNAQFNALKNGGIDHIRAALAL